MNVRERTLAVLHREKPDKIPWISYEHYIPRGQTGREMRNKGLGIQVYEKCFTVSTPNVSIEEKKVESAPGKATIEKTYHTPVGSVSQKIRTTPFYINKYIHISSFLVEHMVKDLDDYDVARFIIEDHVFHPDYEPIEICQRAIGDDGVVFTVVSFSPFMDLSVNYMGFNRLAIDLFRNPGEVEKLMKLLDRNREKVVKIAADSPVEVLWIGDNIDAQLIGPKLFERYCVPDYNKYGPVLHKKGKLVLVHMDGRLKDLVDLVPKADIDIVEAFTPPPMGDLPPAEAKAAWGDKIIWINFPGTVMMWEPQEIRKYTVDLLKSIAPGDGFVMSMNDSSPHDARLEAIKVITEVMDKYGSYPISI